MTKQKHPLVGKTMVRRVGGIDVTVRVEAVRSSYGRLDAKVVPVSAAGEQWVSLDSLQAPGKEGHELLLGRRAARCSCGRWGYEPGDGEIFSPDVAAELHAKHHLSILP